MLSSSGASRRDVAAISRAPFPEIEAFKKRMGWRFKWVSSFGNDFNHDYHVSFTKDEIAKGKVYYNYGMTNSRARKRPGSACSTRIESGAVFHTYSAYARGLEHFIGTYNFLDLVPKGRDEDGLEFTMSWVRHHDRYDDGYLADPDKPYWPKTGAELKS